MSIRVREMLPRWVATSGLVLALAVTATVTGCRSQGAVHSALHDDLKELRRQIEAEKEAGKLDAARTADIARAVLEREVHSARGPAGTRRVRSMRSCAGPLVSILRERAETPDEVGAEAALILVERRAYRQSALERYARSDSGAWRAVAARDTEDKKSHSRRADFFDDPDERVRRAALQSAAANPNGHDRKTLLEVARLDPDPMSRNLATSALGKIGGEDTVLRLKDRWQRADEGQRLSIVQAWGDPASYSTGGKRELVRLAEGQSGFPALEAARLLTTTDEDVRDIGFGRMLAFAADGTREERRLALGVLPLERPESIEVLKKASDDTDPAVAVLAQARLLETKAEASKAQIALRKSAEGKGTIAVQARAALAAGGDQSMIPALQDQLASKRRSYRYSAAMGLIRLGHPEEAAMLLASEDPQLRTDVACAIVR